MSVALSSSCLQTGKVANQSSVFTVLVPVAPSVSDKKNCPISTACILYLFQAHIIHILSQNELPTCALHICACTCICVVIKPVVKNDKT